MKEFILQYWHELAELALFLVVILITLLKKKVKVFDSISTEILSMLPGLINYVETPGHGELKLSQVLTIINNYLKNKFPDFKIGSYDDFIVENIEKILSTPKKKEDSNGKR